MALRVYAAIYNGMERVLCCYTLYYTSLRCRWQTRATQCLAPTVLYTDVDGQGDKLRPMTVTSLPHWSST